MNFKLKKRVYLALASVLFLVLSEYKVINIAPEEYNQFVDVIAILLTTLGILIDPKNISEEVNKEENIGA